MIFDMHIHVFPDFLAARALSGIGETSHVPPVTLATVADTKAKLKAWGISGAAVMNIATKPQQQTNLNNWAADIQDDFYHCFGSVHPDAPDAIQEIERIKQLGLHGIKLHPDYQNFFVKEKKAYLVYEAIQASQLPVTFHAGWDPFSPEVVHTPPKDLAQIARDFPHMTIIAAHMGGMARCDEVEEYLLGLKNVYLDTSMSYFFCSAEQTKRIILKHGTDRILFASDCPWSQPQEEISVLNQLGLPDDVMENIFYKNASRLLGFA